MGLILRSTLDECQETGTEIVYRVLTQPVYPTYEKPTLFVTNWGIGNAYKEKVP